MVDMAVNGKEQALQGHLPEGTYGLQNIPFNSGVVKCHGKAQTEEQCSTRMGWDPQFLKIESPGHCSACRNHAK